MTTRRSLIASALLAAPSLAVAQPVTLRVLSAGAVEPGLLAALAGYPTRIEITFATAPAIRTRMVTLRERPDVVIAPPGLLQEMAARLAEQRVAVGRVGIGIVVNLLGASLPIPDVPTLRQRLLEADSIVINRASTGQYMDAVFTRMGITGAIAGRILRTDTGAEVMERIGRSTAIRGIGFAPTTEIRMAVNTHPVLLLSPLPADVQSYTPYSAAALRESPQAGAARALLAHLGSPEARAAMEGAGVEPPR